MLLLRGATCNPLDRNTCYTVSIHAPLARSNITRKRKRVNSSFNTCSSCEEQHVTPELSLIDTGFNTCSSCEEQQRGGWKNAASAKVSIHAPLARSNFDARQKRLDELVSIHAPLARSNLHPTLYDNLNKFQYMLLLRGATYYVRTLTFQGLVSIHAPLARSNW